MIPMIDLMKQYRDIEGEILKEVKDVLESGQYILGPKVRSFEEEIASYHNVRNAIGVASGTDALNLALKALDIGEGDEVITTPFTFFATIEAIIYQGAKPVFVDIEPDTLNIDVEMVEASITPKTKAILPVHIFGHPVNMNSLIEIADAHGIAVVEDCAQAFGAEIKGRKVGTFGSCGCFSFYPSKNLGGYGDGGLVITDDDEVAERIRMIRNHGSSGGYIHKKIGLNSRLDELQAAILRVKLKKIDHYNELRRQRAKYYYERLSHLVTCPVEKEGYYHVYHQYTIRTPLRDKLRENLNTKGISSVVYYPVPLHLQDALRFLGYHSGDFPVAEQISKEVLSLPIYPELPEDTQEMICHVIEEILA